MDNCLGPSLGHFGTTEDHQEAPKARPKQLLIVNGALNKGEVLV